MMKLRKAIGVLLFGFGCALTFIGLLALILPSIQNDQLKLVLASFEAPSDNMLVRWMNSGMSYALNNGWKVLIAGVIPMMIGLMLLLLFIREPQAAAPQRDPYRRPVQPREPLWDVPPQQPEYQPNPFADMALWDQQFAPQKSQQPEHSFASFGGPMLEPNRIDDAPVYSFAADVYARPVSPANEPPSHEAADPEPSAYKPESFSAPSEEAHQQPAAFSPPPSLDAAAQPKSEPVYTPNEEPDAPAQISSRIRSTMGMHRQR